MNQSPGVRAMIALAAGVLVWNALFQVLFFTGGAAIIELVVITAVAAAFTMVVFRRPTLRALIGLSAGVLSWKALLQLLFFNGGAISQMLVITGVAALFTMLVFHSWPKTRAPTVR